MSDSTEDQFDGCKENCKKTVTSQADLNVTKECYEKCLAKICDKFELQCKCMNDNGLLKPHCSYCCESQKITTDIKLCSAEEEPEGKVCEQFRNSDWRPNFKSCYTDLDPSHCNDLTKISRCVISRVNNFNKTSSCKNTLINCRCIKTTKNENTIECFWGCEDKVTDRWQYYAATPQFENNYITNQTNNADDGGTICPECPSCVEKGTYEKIEDTENCIKEKLWDTFKIYEAQCYCIKDQNGYILKKCMWRGIELQCGLKSDMCNRQVVGSYGIPSNFLDPLDIVECENGTKIDCTKARENFMVHLCSILIVYNFN